MSGTSTPHAGVTATQSRHSTTEADMEHRMNGATSATTTAAPAVEFEKVTLVFGDRDPRKKPVLAVDNVNLAIPAGQFVAIVGRADVARRRCSTCSRGSFHRHTGQCVVTAKG